MASLCFITFADHLAEFGRLGEALLAALLGLFFVVPVFAEVMA
jgi:hypothetical protein